MYLSFDIIFINCTHTKSKDVTVSNLEIVNSGVKFICIKQCCCIRFLEEWRHDIKCYPIASPSINSCMRQWIDQLPLSLSIQCIK